MNINGYELLCTCSGCPEQYDVVKDSEVVGYLRLRHGWFRADVGEITVYEAYPQGDGFFRGDERTKYLTNAIVAIDTYLREQ